jgi:N-acetylglucosaminyldiphosphoundecaprenol N-acetyl-beta-D-mannosaminyltransferase
MNKINILGIKYSDISIAEAVEYSMRVIDTREGSYVLAPDSELALSARKSRNLMSAIRGAGLILPGDRGIFIASKILGLPLHYKMSGTDYVSALLARLSGQGGSVFLLGSRPQSVKLAADGIIERYPGIKLAGTADGRFVDDTELLDVINDVSPDLLLVCMSSPKQELWLADACTELNVGLSVGLGTVIEGHRKEGFFRRLFHNPGRTLKIPRMILAALWKRIAG